MIKKSRTAAEDIPRESLIKKTASLFCPKEAVYIFLFSN